MKTYFTFMKESYTLYHPSYTSAINAALQKHSDLNVSPEDRDTHIAMGPRKPAEGETVKHSIPATDKSGNKHMIHIQVYNKGGNKPFELNTYSSKVSKKKVAEETEMRHSSYSLGDHKALIDYAEKHGGTSTQFTRENIKTIKEEEDINEANSHREVDDLKSKGKHHEAGILAAKSSHDRQYGAHFGMRSGKEEAQRQFFKGYDSVKKTNEEADIDEALGTIKNMKAASKFSSSNVSDMIRGEKARKAGMAKVSTTKDIGYRVVDVGPGQKETIRKIHNFKEEAQQVYEEHMSEKDAERLAQKHVNAAISAKKAGNLKGHDAHAAASNNIRDSILKHTDSAKGIPSKKILSIAKKLFGESDLAEKEEMEINELDRGGIISRYIRKAGPGGSENFPKRKKGVDLALLKKWGDKGYGLPEPKVKAVQREEVEPLAEISAALAKRASRLAMDE